MFRKAKLPWEFMLQIAVGLVLKQYGITEGVLVADDSDHKRSKSTKRIFKTHKLKDKSSGGYVNGQTIMLLQKRDTESNFAGRVRVLPARSSTSSLA